MGKPPDRLHPGPIYQHLTYSKYLHNLQDSCQICIIRQDVLQLLSGTWSTLPTHRQPPGSAHIHLTVLTTTFLGNWAGFRSAMDL